MSNDRPRVQMLEREPNDSICVCDSIGAFLAQTVFHVNQRERRCKKLWLFRRVARL
jgi:hypothetical protein